MLTREPLRAATAQARGRWRKTCRRPPRTGTLAATTPEAPPPAQASTTAGRYATSAQTQPECVPYQPWRRFISKPKERTTPPQAGGFSGHAARRMGAGAHERRLKSTSPRPSSSTS